MAFACRISFTVFSGCFISKGVFEKLNDKVLELSEATSRQRRNLLLTSVALMLTSHAGVTFGDNLKLLGASVKLTNPEVIFTFLMVSHIYFAWRYYQYFHVDQAHIALRSQYRNLLDKKLDQILMGYLFRSLPKGVTSITGSYSYSQISKTRENHGFYEVKVDFPSGQDSESSSKIVAVPTKIFKLRGIPVALKFMFRGKILTDYYLPFSLALYALVINFPFI